MALAIPLWELAKGNIGGGAGEHAHRGGRLRLLCWVWGSRPRIYVFMGQLRTRITQDGIDIRWGFLEVIKKKIPFSDIEKAEAVTYSPIGEFGGWGIRMGGKKKRAWTIRGNRALLLHLKDGTRFYLGSDKPERMLQWVTVGDKDRGSDE